MFSRNPSAHKKSISKDLLHISFVVSYNDLIERSQRFSLVLAELRRPNNSSIQLVFKDFYCHPCIVLYTDELHQESKAFYHCYRDSLYHCLFLSLAIASVQPMQPLQRPTRSLVKWTFKTCTF